MALQTRPPVVTILGHVDHGKTTLLDYIRKTSVAAREHGGITQSIGAYQALWKDKTITFIDTPGHAAFEKMRSRGAQLADIAVLVIAIDDGIMPQTVEAIKHILSAKIPMVVAVNKIDLPGINQTAQMEKIKHQLADQSILVEEYAGDVPIVGVSAQTGEKVDALLENIVLLSEIHDFKGDEEAPLVGIIIESKLDKFKGAIATVLIRDGSLKKGDPLLAPGAKGRVRGMFDYAGKPVDVALPSMPVEVLGFELVPTIGSRIGDMETIKTAEKEKQVSSLISKLRENDAKLLTVVIRADKQGSLEAVLDIIEKFNQEEKHIKVMSSGTGNITDRDVEMADASRGIVLGFNVDIAPSAAKTAETERILVRTYKIIYEMEEELEDVVEGMLKPGRIEDIFGRAQILAEFPHGKERIAGTRIVEGVISKGPKVRVVRGEEVIGEGKLKSIKKVKDEVPKVEKGMECGMVFDPPIDFAIGDIVESFRTY